MVVDLLQSLDIRSCPFLRPNICIIRSKPLLLLLLLSRLGVAAYARPYHDTLFFSLYSYTVGVQEVTPNIYSMLQSSSWWSLYKCSVTPNHAFKRAYFCVQVGLAFIMLQRVVRKSKIVVEIFKFSGFAFSVLLVTISLSFRFFVASVVSMETVPLLVTLGAFEN